ncbi:MAG: hypothetical protein WC334_10065 [Kiritimatiellales bacterium]|jgi:hypothetical protein
MKKLLLFSMIAIAGITASAADITKEQFIADGKAASEKRGTEFNEKMRIAAFEKQDLNKDGVLSTEEQAANKSAAQKGKAKGKKK